MPARALLVLLVMLNFGVATWWVLRPGPLPPTPWAPAEGVPTLRLPGEPVRDGDDAASGSAAAGGAGDVAAAVGSTGSGVAPPEPASGADGTIAAAGTDLRDAAIADAGASGATGASNPAATTPQLPPESPLRCMSFGPYADAASVAAARGALQPLGATRTRVRDVIDAPRGWRVTMAAQADRAAADALAAKIRAAGFDDLLVVPSGDEANAIALGRYGSEPAARRRESTLRAAGFPARAQPLGEATTRYWLDLAAGPAFDAAAARAAAGASDARTIDCAGVVAAAAR
ncbi:MULTISPECIES: SPOR domain-containing protein [unclassified Luteimonas]|uniref:SPOR domain-containing protein n=1 Tax=unclassified Luteimonas TaxID=2629088 RepID=UPI0018F0B2B4|nr:MULTISPECIES: SPOR domain-containing protein [unclassified Luteimonas]MBJ6978883.1 SPOR domain-containing protein [Luteimonas sp. MC1895]MBJ6984924.1 SPOR domain-containing protein [Luteimonas sp. MC1750]QQO05604.1 SPOR domain-containing protein [Luteimonas sp. MC1750]